MTLTLIVTVLVGLGYGPAWGVFAGFITFGLVVLRASHRWEREYEMGAAARRVDDARRAQGLPPEWERYFGDTPEAHAFRASGKRLPKAVTAKLGF
jgi:Zn-dependent protease with chaperone function